jgi:hypothetical protein
VLRSKTAGKCSRQEEKEHKYAKIAEWNKKFKERREKSLKHMLNCTLNRKPNDQQKGNNPISSNCNSMTESIANFSTVPLHQKYKSSAHFITINPNDSPFIINESS